jgi:hypothetical protein
MNATLTAKMRPYRERCYEATKIKDYECKKISSGGNYEHGRKGTELIGQ